MALLAILDKTSFVAARLNPAPSNLVDSKFQRDKDRDKVETTSNKINSNLLRRVTLDFDYQAHDNKCCPTTFLFAIFPWNVFLHEKRSVSGKCERHEAHLCCLTFSNFAASLFDQSLHRLSALPASFTLNHLLSLQAPRQLSLFLNNERQISLVNFARPRLDESDDLALFSSIPNIELADRSEEERQTWTLPTVIPFPSGPLSSKTLSKNFNCVTSCLIRTFGA